MDNEKDLVQEVTPVQENIPESTPKKTKKAAPSRSKILYYGLLAVFSAVFLLSAVYLASYFLQNSQAEGNYDAMASIRESVLSSIAQDTEATQATQPTDATDSTEATQPTAPTEPVMLPELVPLYEINNYLVGYLSIPCVEVDLPVVQTPDKPDYYLRRDFYTNEYSTPGCLYVREKCNVFAPSDSVVIYGHAMRNQTMFGQLYKFQDKAFWEENQTFTFDTLYERHTYQIFAVFKTSGTQRRDDGTPLGYPYHRFNDAASKEEFDKFVADIKGAAFQADTSYVGATFFETGITPQYGDKLLCLSTCENTIDNGRLVIMAVRIA